MYKSNTSLTSNNIINNSNKVKIRNKNQRPATSYSNKYKTKNVSNLRLSLSTFKNNNTKPSYNHNNNFNTTSNNINTDYTNIHNKKKLNYPSIRPYSSIKSPYQISNTLNNKNSVLNKKYKPSDFQRHFYDEPLWKKTLKGKFLHLLKNNIILNEDKFNPLSFVESIAPKVEGEFKNKFKPLDDRLKVNIFTNNFPTVLLCNEKFYTRYFDYFLSIDELLKRNFTEEEIFQIKSDPFYFKFDNKYNNVEFFKKKSLTEQLNEEEKIGIKKIVKHDLRESLKSTNKKMRKYLDYYTYVMSQKDFISNRYLVQQRNKQNFIGQKDEEYKF